jgi:hypothetical protein
MPCSLSARQVVPGVPNVPKACLAQKKLPEVSLNQSTSSESSRRSALVGMIGAIPLAAVGAYWMRTTAPPDPRRRRKNAPLKPQSSDSWLKATPPQPKRNSRRLCAKYPDSKTLVSMGNETRNRPTSQESPKAQPPFTTSISLPVYRLRKIVFSAQPLRAIIRQGQIRLYNSGPQRRRKPKQHKKCKNEPERQIKGEQP